MRRARLARNPARCGRPASTIRCTSIGTLRVRLDRRAHQRTDRQVGNVMVVHHVEVDEVGAGGDRPRAPPRPGARSRRTGATAQSGRSWASGYNPREQRRVRGDELAMADEQAIRRSRWQPMATYPRRPVRPGEEPVRLLLHDHDHQHRRRRRAAREPPLDHHRRRPQGAGGARAWAWSASSRCSSPARASNTRAARRSRPPWARCAAATRWCAEDGQAFDAPIPPFTLSVPRTLH